jgi:1-acyl-sn-glycerol-3-phosphate acyltransferase
MGIDPAQGKSGLRKTSGLYIGRAARLMLSILALINAILLRVRSGEHLRNGNQPIIFAANHNAYYETVLFAAYVIRKQKGRKLSFMVDWTFRFFPFLGWAIGLIDPVYVYTRRAILPSIERKRPDETHDTIEEMLDRLATGYSVIVFPEGGLNPNPRKMRHGHNGIGRIALRSRAPVQPVGIDFPLRQKKNKIPAFGRLVFNIGAKIEFVEEISEYEAIRGSAALSEADKARLESRIEARVTYRIMKAISALCGKRYDFEDPNPPAGQSGTTAPT